MAEIKITKDLLIPFVSKDETRPGLADVFRQHGYVIASDGHLLIRVLENMVDDLAQISEQGLPNTDSIIPKELPWNKTITKDCLLKALTKAPKVEEKIKCEDCHGSGKVEWTYEAQNGHEYTDNFECPVCHGKGHHGVTGKLVPDPQQLYSLAGGAMNTECLYDLIRVMETFKVKKMLLRSSDNFKAMFTIGEVQVLKAFVIIEGEDKPLLDEMINIR